MLGMQCVYDFLRVGYILRVIFVYSFRFIFFSVFEKYA